ncbi:MAG TPA: alpha/beta hydrolase [Burkholderiaceae bacterium]|nr:alpha/beta hydrolase [Burkholderiaceae bacterium]
MRSRPPGCRGFVNAMASLLLTLSLVCAAQAQQPVTERSAVARLDKLKQTYEVRNFRIGGKYDLANPKAWDNGGEGGTTLESLGAAPARTSYIAVGTPKRDAKGEIVNAIVISTFFSGDATSMYDSWYEGQPGNGFAGGALVGPGRMFDTNRYYVIFLDGLGLWGASKPSDGLGRKFPVYTYYDMVQLNYRMLRDHLKVGQVVLATGVSMGGTQSYYWGLMYPDFVKAVMPVGGASATDGPGGAIAAWTFQLAKASLESDPVWIETNANYYELPKDKHPNAGVEFHWSQLLLTGFDLDFRQATGWDAVSKDVFTWKADPRLGKDVGANLKRMAAQFDAVDLWYRDTVGELHNVDKLLPGMKPRTLVAHVDNDLWLMGSEARKAAEVIPGGLYASFSDPIAHYAVFKAPNVLKDNQTFASFLRATGVNNVAEQGIVCEAKNYRRATVNMTPDPNKSFWKDEIVYPFPVKYANAKDKNGVDWQIGYMDEYCGKERNPPTLVMVHGKGAFGAHYGNVVKYAVERGFRVIVPDMPLAGVSGPGNLDKPQARTLDDIRDAFHALIVGQLGVKKAYYYGHSQGGQVVLGYALNYPQAVQGLLLEGPAGLEEYPKNFKMGDKVLPICDRSIGRDLARWHAAWDPFGLVEAERSRSPQWVRDFFYWKTRDAAGNQIPAPSGYFVNDTPYSRLHTDQRIAMITGNKREFDQYTFLFHYDTFSMCSENAREDENSLYKRLPQIKAPIFLAFGAIEPFIPSTALNGLTDKSKQIIIPFMERMSAAGNAPVVKIYPGVGHFIHTDVPLEFARDVVSYMKTGRVDAMTPQAVDSLINGARPMAAAAPAAGGDKPAGLAK